LAAVALLAAYPVIGSAAEPPSKTVLIPAGTFAMGAEVEDDHMPPHEVTVDGFIMDRHEVTNAEYAEFVREVGRNDPEFWGIDELESGPEFPDHPVVGITWRDAADYCEWRGMRLPTEAEWEYAARGGLEGKKWPWGDELTPEKANYNPSDGLKSVGSYPPNGYGLYDMAGNTAEWTADFYDPDYYASSPADNPTGPEKTKYRVVRGGGWHSGPYCTRVYRRLGLLAYWVDIAVGFRCADNAPDANAPPRD
jgi:formylglycine-generating enzyme required for sulfatase activity